MNRPVSAVLLTSLLGLTILTAAEQAVPPAAPAPRAAAPAAPAPSAPVTPMTSRAVPAASPAATAADHNALVKQVLRHLPQRSRQGWRADAGLVRHRETHERCGHRREDDSQAAGRHDAALRRQAAGRGDSGRAHDRARNPHRPRRERHPLRRPRVPASEPRGVCARGARPAGPRHRRLRPAAGRHHQRRVRQRVRLADVLADADGGVSARRQQGDVAGGRRLRRRVGRGPLPGAEDLLADGARRGRAVRYARRGVGDSHLPGGRRLRVPHAAARQRRRLPVRWTGHGRAGRGLDRRRARRGGRRRAAHGRRHRRSGAEDAGHPRHRRAAPGVRGLHPPLRRPGQRSDRADRPHAGRHADRRLARHHDPASPQGPGDCRAAEGDRHLRHAEPPQDLRLPPDRSGRRADVRRAHRPRAGDAGVPPPGLDARLRSADDVLQGRPRRWRLRVRRRLGDRGDPRQPAVPVPPRAGAGDGGGGAALSSR